eukprot:scaffold40488_cov65-Phaeocystis_antarctica.AAC.2
MPIPSYHARQVRQPAQRIAAPLAALTRLSSSRPHRSRPGCAAAGRVCRETWSRVIWRWWQCPCSSSWRGASSVTGAGGASE